MEMGNKIETQIELKASVARVWKALTDSRQFGEWFGVKFKNQFELGKEAVGSITTPGYEHLPWKAMITKIEHERLFAFTWHPYGIDPKVDYGKETPTLVEFRLEKNQSGTTLKLTESGFDQVPEGRRAEAFRMNSKGWEIQMSNIDNFLNQNV